MPSTRTDPPNRPRPESTLDTLSRTIVQVAIVLGGIYFATRVYDQLSAILLPLIIAVLVCALVAPVTYFLRHKLHLPAAIAAILTVVGLLAIIVGLLFLVIPGIASEFSDIEDQVVQGVNQIPQLLRDAGLSDKDVSNLTDNAVDRLRDSVGAIGSAVSSGALSAATGLTNVATVVVLAIITCIYLLTDGAGFWRGIVRFAPPSKRRDMDAAGRRAWDALGSFVRSQVLVAMIDGIGIGIGLWIIGVPLALPIGVLTFIVAFLPYIGAIVAGLVAILVALATKGVDAAIGALVITIIVQQLEGNVLYPLLIGRSIRLHPITVLLGVGAGGALLGITGTFLATPLIASIAAAAGWLDREDEEEELDRVQEMAEHDVEEQLAAREHRLDHEDESGSRPAAP